MPQKRALITGITGQDGSYLAEFLLAKGYEVHGLVRRVALEDPENRLSRLAAIRPQLHLHSGSLESYASIHHVLGRIEPDECYHLAAQSFVTYSFDDEFSTLQANINGVGDEALRRQVIALVRFDAAENVVDAGVAFERARVQVQLRPDGSQTGEPVLGVFQGHAAHQPVDFIPLGKKEFREIGAILARDAGDQRPFLRHYRFRLTRGGIPGGQPVRGRVIYSTG